MDNRLNNKIKREHQILGGIVTGKIQHQKMLDDYYKNPALCKFCNKIIEIKEGQRARDAKRKQFCNISCRRDFFKLNPLSKEIKKKYGNGSSGHKHTEETKEKIRIANLGIVHSRESIEKQIKTQRENILSGKTIPYWKGKHLSKETKEKLSLLACSNTHKSNNFKHVPYIDYLRKDRSIIKLRGSYEIRFAKYLDNNNIYWNYQKNISYINNLGIKHFMMPDFYLIDFDKFIDTKGYLSEEYKCKMNLVKKQTNINIILIYLKDIEALEQGKIKIYDYF